MSDTEEKVKRIIAEQLGCDPAYVIGGAYLVEELGVDALDRLEVFEALEAAFGVKIPDIEAETIETVQDAIDYFSR